MKNETHKLYWGAHASRVQFSASRRKHFAHGQFAADGLGATPKPTGETPVLPE